MDRTDYTHDAKWLLLVCRLEWSANRTFVRPKPIGKILANDGYPLSPVTLLKERPSVKGTPLAPK